MRHLGASSLDTEREGARSSYVADKYDDSFRFPRKVVQLIREDTKFAKLAGSEIGTQFVSATAI